MDWGRSGDPGGGHGTGGYSMIAAAFSRGGLGKTSLARQYAHAYAEFYAAGGTWALPCEGVTELGAILPRLAEDPAFQRMGRDVDEPLTLGDAERADFVRAATAVLDHLRTVTHRRVERLMQQLRRHPELHTQSGRVNGRANGPAPSQPDSRPLGHWPRKAETLGSRCLWCDLGSLHCLGSVRFFRGQLQHQYGGSRRRAPANGQFARGYHQRKWLAESRP